MSFLDKIFTAIGKSLRKGAIKTLSKKDPQFAKDAQSIEDLRADIKRRIANQKKKEKR